MCRAGRSPDVIVHNVAIQIRQPWQLVGHAAFQKQMNANFWAGLRLFQLGARPMTAAKWGRLIAIGSVQEIIPHEEMVVYAAAKAAFANVVLNLSRQLGVHGITVNSIAPGVIATGRNRKVLEDAAYSGRLLRSIAAGYFGQPRDCAGVALLLATDAGRLHQWPDYPCRWDDARLALQEGICMIRLGMLLLPTVDNRWNLALQMGVRHVIAKLSPELTGGAGPYDYETLREHVRRYAAFGFQIDALEGDQFDMSAIKMGLDGRTEAVESYKRMLQNMGKRGISTLCYNFMPIGWYRTRYQVMDRGGSLVTGYRHAEEPQNSTTVLSADALWKHYAWFLKAVLPAAEDAGVRLALHPDDPPALEIKGIGRIFISAEDVERALSLSNSPMHGLTLCQATYKTMGEDVPALARSFGARRKIFFIHIRDVKGTSPDFVETFP